jgi:hypothetical protein
VLACKLLAGDAPTPETVAHCFEAQHQPYDRGGVRAIARACQIAVLAAELPEPVLLKKDSPPPQATPPAQLFKPGETCPVSGQYELVDETGQGTEIERTVTAGEPFPPTEEAGWTFRLIDITQHRNPV